MKKLRTMGRWPTKGELIEYYSRDDICAVIYYQSKRWKILMEKDYILEPISEKDTREKILDKLCHFTRGVKETERLKNYPTMHLLRDRGEGAEVRYDFMAERDPDNWREAFESMAKALDVLDAHDVYYQIKFSGHRSLHLLIPAESFPKTFRGRDINEQFREIHDQIKSYLPSTGESPIGLRVVYSTHPIGGLASIPLRRRELPNFQPWMANIHTVVVDFDWFAIPEDAVERNEKFLHTIFNSQRKRVSVKPPHFEPQPVRAYAGDDVLLSEAEVLSGIDSKHPQERVAATRAALLQNIHLPLEKLKQLLHGIDKDVVWFAMEIILRDTKRLPLEEVIHILERISLLKEENDYLIEPCYRLQATLEADALCGYLISKGEINRKTILVAQILSEVDWDAFVNLPKRIEASSLREWFEKVWLVCGLALCLSHPEPIFESAYLQAKMYETNESEPGKRVRKKASKEEVTFVIHQLELLLKLRNTQPYKKVQDEPLFEAAEQLIQYGHDLRGILIAMLSNEHSNPVYYGATRLLTRLWWDEAINLLIDGLGFASPRNKSILRTLVEIGSAAVPALCQTLNNRDRASLESWEDNFICTRLIWALGAIGDSAALDALIKALEDENWNVRAVAARTLGQIGDTAALSALAEVLEKEKKRKVRQQAVAALGQIGTPAAVEILSKALSDENQHVRLDAEGVLKQIGTPEAIKVLEEFKREN